MGSTGVVGGCVRFVSIRPAHRRKPHVMCAAGCASSLSCRASCLRVLCGVGRVPHLCEGPSHFFQIKLGVPFGPLDYFNWGMQHRTNASTMVARARFKNTINDRFVASRARKKRNGNLLAGTGHDHTMLCTFPFFFSVHPLRNRGHSALCFTPSPTSKSIGNLPQAQPRGRVGVLRRQRIPQHWRVVCIYLGLRIH